MLLNTTQVAQNEYFLITQVQQCGYLPCRWTFVFLDLKLYLSSIYRSYRSIDNDYIISIYRFLINITSMQFFISNLSTLHGWWSFRIFSRTPSHYFRWWETNNFFRTSLLRPFNSISPLTCIPLITTLRQ